MISPVFFLHSGAASFDGEVLHDLGHIVEGLDSIDIAEIPSNVVEENVHVFAEADLQPEEAVAVVKKTESARRKRRAVGRQRIMCLKSCRILLSALSTSKFYICLRPVCSQILPSMLFLSFFYDFIISMV